MDQFQILRFCRKVPFVSRRPKYNLPQIYHVIGQMESLEGCKSLIKKQLDSYVEKEWGQDSKVSLQCLNVQSLRIGQTHHVWK